MDAPHPNEQYSCKAAGERLGGTARIPPDPPKPRVTSAQPAAKTALQGFVWGPVPVTLSNTARWPLFFPHCWLQHPYNHWRSQGQLLAVLSPARGGCSAPGAPGQEWGQNGVWLLPQAQRVGVPETQSFSAAPCNPVAADNAQDGMSSSQAAPGREHRAPCENPPSNAPRLFSHKLDSTGHRFIVLAAQKPARRNNTMVQKQL